MFLYNIMDCVGGGHNLARVLTLEQKKTLFSSHQNHRLPPPNLDLWCRLTSLDLLNQCERFKLTARMLRIIGGGGEFSKTKELGYTICPRSNYPFYIVTYYIKWITTYWTHSNSIKKVWHYEHWFTKNFLAGSTSYFYKLSISSVFSRRSYLDPVNFNQGLILGYFKMDSVNLNLDPVNLNLDPVNFNLDPVNLNLDPVNFNLVRSISTWIRPSSTWIRPSSTWIRSFSTFIRQI